MSTRKVSANILSERRRCTNAEIGSAATIMTATLSTTAMTMMLTLSAMPTAVITESSEKMMSMIVI